MSNYLKKSIIGLLFISTHSYAGKLPDELLKTPIHLTSGKTVSLAEYQGVKPVYLKFWATWCQPCRKQMTHFQHAQQKYGDEIVIIGINLGLNDDLDAVTSTINEFGLTMPMAIDEVGDLAQIFRLVGTPYHLLFDKNLNLVHQGHEANLSLDSKLELVSRSQLEKSEIVDSSILIESEKDISIDVNDGKLHALFFSATWCDWYLRDSRPLVAERCVIAQNTVNSVFQQSTDVSWLGVINRLWTGDKDMMEYMRKYSIIHPIQIDKSNRLFHRYKIHNIPTLLIIKNDTIIDQMTDFSDADQILALLADSKN